MSALHTRPQGQIVRVPQRISAMHPMQASRRLERLAVLSLKNPPKNVHERSTHGYQGPELYLGNEGPAAKKMLISVPTETPRKSAELSDNANPGWAVTLKLSTREAPTPAMEEKEVKEPGSVLGRGPGALYQAVPVVDANGKNILKLVPMKTVNVNKLVRPQQINTLTYSSTSQQTFIKPLSFVNALPNEVRTPATKSPNPLIYPCHLPVMVKSPALPKGQCLQIPPNAKVQTLPASKLPVTIKNHIFNPSAGICPEPGGPKVVCVSPVTTVNKGFLSSPNSEHQTSRVVANMTSLTDGSKPYLKLVPKAPERPNGPVQWVIEEEVVVTEKASSHNHLNSSVISQIVHTVKERERVAQQQCDLPNGDASSPGEGTQDQDIALVMCNGKVFFVGKKSSVQKNNEASVQQTQTSPKRIIPDKCDEVIDLCDDEAQDDSPQTAAGSVSAVSHQEDDCVIFVSYIPPKADDRSKQALCNSGPKGTSNVGTATRVESTGGADLAGEFPLCGMNKGPNLKAGRKRPHSTAETSEDFQCVCDSAVMTKNVSVTSPERSSDQQVRESSHDRRATCSTTKDKREEHATADTHLMRVFGIKADVKIHLHRIDEALAVLPKSLKNGSISLRKNHLILYDSCKNKEGNGWRSVTRLTEDDRAADETPFPCAVFNLNSSPRSDLAKKCRSGQSVHTGEMFDIKSAALVNYLEPIDEDFIDADEDEAMGKDTNTRRMGRTRKRTMCRCCVPGDEGPVVKVQMKK